MPPRRPGAGSRRHPAAAPPAAGADRILAVAITSFAERGYDGTTTAGVARAAGVTQPLIHHHFGSKEGLWRAAMEALFADVAELTVPPGTADPDVLFASIARFVAFVARRPEMTRVIAREGASPSPRLTYLVEHYLRAPFTAVVSSLRAAQRAGSVSRGIRPEHVLFLFLGAGSHVFDVAALAQESVGFDPTTPRARTEFAALLVDVFRRGLLTPAP